MIVAYPGFDLLLSNGNLKKEVKDLWSKLPTFKRLMDGVPTLHIPLQKEAITKALSNSNFSLSTKCKPSIYRYDE